MLWVSAKVMNSLLFSELLMMSFVLRQAQIFLGTNVEPLRFEFEQVEESELVVQARSGIRAKVINKKNP